MNYVGGRKAIFWSPGSLFIDVDAKLRTRFQDRGAGIILAMDLEIETSITGNPYVKYNQAL